MTINIVRLILFSKEIIELESNFSFYSREIGDEYPIYLQISERYARSRFSRVGLCATSHNSMIVLARMSFSNVV